VCYILPSNPQISYPWYFSESFRRFCRRLSYFLLPSVSILLSFQVFTRVEPFVLSDTLLQQTEQRYGAIPLQRVLRWQALINNSRGNSDWNKLHKANDFANREVSYASDETHWGKSDYWATPLESLQTAAGDCEDYVILKYFMLRAMGVDEDKLRLMYVRALTQNEPHMVLTYTEKPGQYPLVLDNINPKILPANKRTDLRPVYAFNASGLWMAKAQGLGNKVENSAGVAQWQLLLERIEHGN
jgi:predicted transglutaminase-like cysteine proteinase